MTSRRRFTAICFGLAAWLWCSAVTIAQAGEVVSQPTATSRSSDVAVPSGDLQGTVEGFERLYKIEAVGFKALDETGIDALGSDEVIVVTFDAKGYTTSREIGDIDSGDTHTFDPAKSCMLPVRPGDVVLGETSVCDDIGEPAPLKVRIELWEQDIDLLGFSLGFFGEPQDDFIGLAQFDFSAQQLEAMLPNVGDEHIETVKLEACRGPAPCDATFSPDYTFTVRITRVSDGVPRPVGLFVSTDGTGNISTLKQHVDWDKEWDRIVPGNFGGDNHTDLLFYKQSTGVGLFVTTDGTGNISTLKQHVDWDKEWDLIVPGNFGGDGHTDLLFYKRSTGDVSFISTDGSGNIQTIKQHTGWYQSWDMIIPGDFGGAKHSDLLFYDGS